MKRKAIIFGLMTLLASLFCAQPVAASKHKHKHHSETSDSSQASCCEKVKRTVYSIEEKQKCQYVIHAKDITKKGFVIDKPGSWCLDGDIEFNPPLSKYAPPDPRAVQAAITIKAGVSNVILNLGNHKISQKWAGTDLQTPFVVGILVPDPAPFIQDINYVGAQSIYIQGDQGIIDGFSMYGIRIFAHVEDIRLSDLTVKNCGLLASKALRPTVYGYPYLPHTNGNPVPVTPGFGPSFGVGGIVIGETTALGMGPQFFVDTPTDVPNNVNRVNEVVIENVTCLNNFFMGGMTPCISNMTITNCHFDNTFSDEPGSSTAPAFQVLSPVGLSLANAGLTGGGYVNGNIDPNCVNVVINNSTFNGTALRGDYTTVITNPGGVIFPAAGAADVRSRNVTWNNCEFNGTTNTFVSFGLGTTGGFISGGLEDYTFNNCHFDNVTAIGTINGFHSSGFNANQPVKSGRNIWLKDCTSSNHRSIGDQALPAPILSSSFVGGFILDYMKDITLDGCISQDLVNSSPVSASSFNSAFSPTSSSNVGIAEMENITLRNCIASRVQTLNGGQALGYNIFCPVIGGTSSTLFNSMRSSIYENCIASGCEAFAAPSTSTPFFAPPYSAATNYGYGVSVTFGGADYVSLQPNGPSTTVVTPGTNPLVWELFVPPSVPANVWSSTVTYNLNSLVIYNGVNYKSLVANNLGNIPSSSPSDWSTTTGIAQGAGTGFVMEMDDASSSNAPTIFKNCIATRNRGALVSSPFNESHYTAGFQLLGGNSVVFDSCIATDNGGYGIILSGSPNLLAFPVQAVHCIVRNCQSDNNSAEGFTDTGTGTPASPTQSLSIWESNRAYNNGTGGIHVGPNGNYNIWMDAAKTLRPPLLEGQASTGIYSVLNTTTSPTAGLYFSNVHNNSIIP